MSFRFKHFQNRLLVFFLVPLIAVLTSVYFAVSDANTSNAISIIEEQLQTGLLNFTNTLDQQNLTLAIAGDSLAGDYAFTTAYNTKDHATQLSTMDNLLSRLIVADFMVMVSETDNAVQADTLHRTLRGEPPQWLALIDTARELYNSGEYPEARDVVIIDATPYLLTVLPFFQPILTDWVGLGTELSQLFTEDLKASVSAEVTIMFLQANNRWHINASTMPEDTLDELTTQFNNMQSNGLGNILTLAGRQYVTLARPISNDGQTVEVVLQRPLAEQLVPFESLRTRLLIIFGVGLALLAFAVVLTSRNVTSPVLELARGARRIESGDYAQQVELPQQDEIGELATAFNNMARGLIEKEKVRDLLGKVVSPEIAAELMSKDLELGGEEREVTILFSDVRGFTSLCEGQSPQQILSLLNEYFSAISAVIEQHSGVVDKYIGDAVMALFGAPVKLDNAASSAISTALGMETCLQAVNASFAARNIAPIGIGIGINTDLVVVGNMGSSSRLNYTAIGDGVNLASRLEGLTSIYGAGIIISAATRKLAPEYLCLPLDRVRVKGKLEPVELFQPLMPLNMASPELLGAVENFTRVLHLYYQGDFTSATIGLEQHWQALSAVLPGKLLLLYQQRCALLQESPPAHWDGVHTFTSK